MASAFQANAFQARPAFQIEGVVPVHEGPRGAWISDERVERARRRRWKKEREQADYARLELQAILEGRPWPPPEPIILPPEPMPLPLPLMIAPVMDAVADVRMAEREAIADEESGIIALMMTGMM